LLAKVWIVIYISIMEIAALNNLSKSELISIVLAQGQTIGQKEQVIEGYKDKESYYQGELARYQELVAQLQRMLFGQKRERFEGENKQEPLTAGSKERGRRAARERINPDHELCTA
jgi:hypothetical protein